MHTLFQSNLYLALIQYKVLFVPMAVNLSSRLQKTLLGAALKPLSSPYYWRCLRNHIESFFHHLFYFHHFSPLFPRWLSPPIDFSSHILIPLRIVCLKLNSRNCIEKLWLWSCQNTISQTEYNSLKKRLQICFLQLSQWVGKIMKKVINGLTLE